MKSNTFFALSALAIASIASPIDNVAAVARDARGSVSIDDNYILTFALTLEHLEKAFYTAASAKFKAADFADKNMYNNLLRLARDEGTHVTRLTQVLSAAKHTVPTPCKYNFPFNTTTEFLKLASVIEGVGVSAYAGAATSVYSKDVLKVAAAILPIEARHDAILRASVDVHPFAAAFDVPLTFQQAWSLASQFIVKGSCPKAVVNLGLSAFPALTLSQNATVKTVAVNSTIALKTNINIGSAGSVGSHATMHKRHESLHERASTVFVAFLTIDGPKTIAAKLDKGVVTVKVPDVHGQIYVVLTSSKTTVTDASILAGPAIVEVADDIGTSAVAGNTLPATGIKVSG